MIEEGTKYISLNWKKRIEVKAERIFVRPRSYLSLSANIQSCTKLTGRLTNQTLWKNVSQFGRQNAQVDFVSHKTTFTYFVIMNIQRFKCHHFILKGPQAFKCHFLFIKKLKSLGFLKIVLKNIVQIQFISFHFRTV